MGSEWNLIDGILPPPHALIIYYVPFARYIWGSGMDYSQIRAEYPGVTHWKVATLEPESKD